MAIAGDIARRQFERDLVRHARECFPLQTVRHDDTVLGDVAALCVDKAAGFDIQLRPDVTRYMGLMLGLGSCFDEDPLLTWATTILNDSRIPHSTLRIARLEARALDHLMQVEGENAEYGLSALRRLRAEPYSQLVPPPDCNLFAYALNELDWLYPQKFEVVGQDATLSMMEAAEESANQIGLTEESEHMLYFTLSFMLGVGFASDPQYRFVVEQLEQYVLSGDSSAHLLHARLMGLLDVWLLPIPEGIA